MFAEFQPIGGSLPLRQGDVLESKAASSSLWDRHLLVITADCDIAHNKHHDRVTCVPLMTAEEYLFEMHLPKLKDRYLKKPITELLEIFGRAELPNITATRVREWVRVQGASEVARSVSFRESDEDRALKLLETIAIIETPAVDTASASKYLVDAQMMSGSAARTSVVKTIAADFNDVFRKTPGDAMFLSALAPGHTSGYFAYLRHLEILDQKEISLGPSRANSRYGRVSRLSDRFTHSIVQRFAMVFMPIGLPAEYEIARDMHMESFKEAVK